MVNKDNTMKLDTNTQNLRFTILSKNTFAVPVCAYVNPITTKGVTIPTILVMNH